MMHTSGIYPIADLEVPWCGDAKSYTIRIRFNLVPGPVHELRAQLPLRRHLLEQVPVCELPILVGFDL